MSCLRIVISQRVVDNKDYVDSRDALSQDWIVYLENLLPNCIIVPMPNRLRSSIIWLNAISPDVVILSNGNDWGNAPHRDRSEKVLLDWATEKNIPLLGVCRGLQALNFLAGGGIEKRLKDVTNLNHVGAEHDVQIRQAAFMKLAGNDSLRVNSFHNEGVTEASLASEFTQFAIAQNGVVEGFFSNERAVLAIQWHPERANPSKNFDTALLRQFFNNGAFWNEL